MLFRSFLKTTKFKIIKYLNLIEKSNLLVTKIYPKWNILIHVILKFDVMKLTPMLTLYLLNYNNLIITQIWKKSKKKKQFIPRG